MSNHNQGMWDASPREFGYGSLTDVFLTVSMYRLIIAEARDAWAMWERVINAYRRLFGEALDLRLDSGEWI